MYHPFSIAETLKAAWNIFKKIFLTVIIYSIVTLFIIGILLLLTALFITTDNWYVGMFVSLIIVAFQAYTTLGLYKLIFTHIDSEIYEFDIKQIFPRFTMLVSFLIIAFLLITISVTYDIMVQKAKSIEILQNILMSIGVLGLLYFILRGIYFICFILDDNSGAFESIKQSFKLTRGHFLHSLAILSIILLLIAVPAILSKFIILAPLLLIFSFPYANIFLMVAYRKLIYSHKDVDDLDLETV